MLSQEVNAEGEIRTREKERDREGEREGYVNQHLCFIKKSFDEDNCFI